MAAYEDNNEDVAELEEIHKGSDPEKGFCCTGIPFFLSYKNPDFLPLVDDQADDISDAVSVRVIFEKDGIPYIDDDACNRRKSAKEELDGKFASLVEAVVYNKGLP